MSFGAGRREPRRQGHAMGPHPSDVLLATHRAVGAGLNDGDILVVGRRDGESVQLKKLYEDLGPSLFVAVDEDVFADDRVGDGDGLLLQGWVQVDAEHASLDGVERESQGCRVPNARARAAVAGHEPGVEELDCLEGEDDQANGYLKAAVHVVELVHMAFK